MRLENAIIHLQRSDRKLGNFIDSHGIIALKPPKGNFETLVNAIVSQQLSTKAAATIYGRVALVLENEIVPDRVYNTPAEELRGAGLSGQKVKYLFALSEAFLQNPELYENLHDLCDEDVIALLTKIKGIGVWTAQMFLIFTLLREDVFPIGDLGVRRGMEKLFYNGEKQTHDVLIKRAEIWAPFRSVASLYLWRSLDG